MEEQIENLATRLSRHNILLQPDKDTIPAHPKKQMIIRLPVSLLY